jgi:hypothetical protein
METHDNQEGQLRAMTLIASLRTAAEVCRAIAWRRAGEDPSEQEASEPVRQHLQHAQQELREVVVRLRLSLAVAPDQEASLVRDFEDRMLLAEAARDLHIVHQRLLSLYPTVDSALVEDARHVQAEAARLAAAGETDFRSPLIAWCDAVVAFADELRRALYTSN